MSQAAWPASSEVRGIKTANCQTLVSLTLARDGCNAMIGLRLFLSRGPDGHADRMTKAHVPEHCRAARTRPRSLWPRLITSVPPLADAGYGLSAPFAKGSMRGV